jgi:hypothetical protein
MNTHAILVACSLLGQASDTEVPAANKYGIGERYGSAVDPKYAAEPKTSAQPRYGSEAPVRRSAGDVRTSDTPAATKQPRTSFGDQFIQDQDAERRQYQADTGEATAAAGDTEPAALTRSPRSSAVQAAPIDPTARRNPQTPVNDPANRSTPGLRNDPVTRPTTESNPRAATDATSKTRTPAPITPLANPKDDRGITSRADEHPVNGHETGDRIGESNRLDSRFSVTDGAATERNTTSRTTNGVLPDGEFTDVRVLDEVAAVFAAPKQIHVKGEPITLANALAKRSDRASRLEIAHAYWKLATAMAVMEFSNVEARDIAEPAIINVARQFANEIHLRMFESARYAAEARFNESIAAVVSAQHDLAEAMGLASGESLPLATDAPFLGIYATRFDELFATRPAPVQIRAIHATLPTLHRTLVLRGRAILEATAALGRAKEAFLERQLGIDTYLAAFQHASAQRQAFLAVARGYNDDIADYAINVARDGTGPVELTSMLIRVRKDTTSPDATRRASQPPAARAAENVRRDVITDRNVPATRGGATSTDAWQSKTITPIP